LVKKRYGRPTVHLPFPIYRQWSEDQFGEPQRQAARIRLGLDPGEIAIVTFGMLHQTKAPRTIIGAVALLRAQKIPAKLYFVGRVIDKSADSLRALSREMGIEPDVRIIDQFISEERYRDYLLAADFGIQLRTHSFGGVSGALQDCISAGLPTVANENLCEAIEAPDYVVRVPNDADPASIADAIAGMIDAN
jgi:glycosyltransferase involved in cell wall biosynthesis